MFGVERRWLVNNNNNNNDSVVNRMIMSKFAIYVTSLLLAFPTDAFDSNASQ